MARAKKITLKLHATGTPTALKTLLIMISAVTNPVYRFRADVQVEGSKGEKKALKMVSDPFKQADDIISSIDDKTKDTIGTEMTQVGPVTLCCMKGNYRECLDKAMTMWEEHKKSLPEKSRESIYGFAYWLIRYSGLVQPVEGKQ